MGITIPITKNSNKTPLTNADGYRGITISPIISKIFEISLLKCIMKYLSTSSLQFGFKPNFGCEDAIYTVNRVVDHFTHNIHTVNICALDMTKAFDRVSHSLLFSKLMDRKVYLKILFCYC